MILFLWVLIGILIVILIIWPPFFWFLLSVGCLWILWFINRRYGPIPPIWTWGEDPLHSIIVRGWLNATMEIRLEYRKNAEEPWIRAETPQIVRHASDNIRFSAKQSYRFNIKGLEEGTSYEYRLVNEAKNKPYYWKPPQKFKTQSSHTTSYRFVVCGDLQMDESIAPLESFIMTEIVHERPEFILFMGDHVGKYKRADLWFAFFRMMRKIFPRIPFYPVIGNHCGGDGGDMARNIYQLCPFDDWNYSWTFQSLYFIAVNSLPLLNQDWEEVHRIEAWIQNKLENRPLGTEFTFVYMHVPWIGPPYANNGQVSFYETYLEHHWKPLFEKYLVDAVFSGHKHSYIRDRHYFVSASIHGVRHYPESKTKDYVVRNGHHYLIIDYHEKTIHIRAKLWDGRIWDEYCISKK